MPPSHAPLSAAQVPPHWSLHYFPGWYRLEGDQLHAENSKVKQWIRIYLHSLSNNKTSGIIELNVRQATTFLAQLKNSIYETFFFVH